MRYPIAEVATDGHSLENVDEFDEYCQLVACTQTTLETVIPNA